MTTTIKTHSLGKLRIYLQTGDNIKSRALLRKIFPTSLYKNIIEMAKEDGLLSANVFNTHLGYSSHAKVSQFSFESDNRGVTVCVELIDTKDKLQQFFIKHKEALKDKVVVYKEVEYWDVE